MARRVVFTDPITGRIISAADTLDIGQTIRSVYDSGQLVERQILEFGRITEDLTQANEPNWEQVDSRWGAAWQAGDDAIDLSALGNEAFPEEFDSFRVTYRMQSNPDYPSGYAASDWMTAEQWPPDLSIVDRPGITGIERIYFRNQ